MTNNAPIRKLPENIQGKDYVVGDLHGCYGLLERLLLEAGFDYARDRLFSVGDLIDRGPDSLRCLQLLSEPWFYAVQGNHELMMLEFFLPYLQKGTLNKLKDIYDTGFLDNGGDWIVRHFQVSRQRMSDEFNHCLSMVFNLPLIWVVGEGESRFHVIHAELARSDYKSSKQRVWQDGDIDAWLEEQSIPAKIQDSLYWGRILMSSRLADQVGDLVQPGLSTTFCGHTYASKPRQFLSHVCVDTGAFVTWRPEGIVKWKNDYSLTLFDVKESRWVSASYQQDEVIWGRFPE